MGAQVMSVSEKAGLTEHPAFLPDQFRGGPLDGARGSAGEGFWDPRPICTACPWSRPSGPGSQGRERGRVDGTGSHVLGLLLTAWSLPQEDLR